MAGVTSLLRSAQAAQKKIKAQQDAQTAYDYANSPKTYDDYTRYYAYLQKRAASISDPGTALTLQKTADSAKKGYISNEIQRATINTLEGRGTSIDKYNKILSFMGQAQQEGQYDLAQSLNLQLDNLGISIQNEAIRAQEAAQRLGELQVRETEKIAKNQGAAFEDMGAELEGGLKDLTRAFQQGGQTAYNRAAKDFITANKGTIEKLIGQKLPKDISTNIGQLIQGTMQGIEKFYALAADAVKVTDSAQAIVYDRKSSDITLGRKSFDTPGGQMNILAAQEFAKNPQGFTQVQDSKTQQFKLVPNKVAGYSVDEQGNVMKQYSPYRQGDNADPYKASNFDKLKGQFGIDQNNPQTNIKQLEKLGFGSVTYNKATGSYSAQLGTGTGKWFKSEDIGLPSDAAIDLIKTADGFQYVDGDGKNLYNFATDKNGLGAVYKIDNLNKQTQIGGQYGFNGSVNSLIKRADFLQTEKQLKIFNEAVRGAQLAQENARIAPRIAAEGSKQVQQYLGSQGQKYFAPDKTNTAANIASENAILLQPYFQSRGQIGGKYYNASGNFIPGYSQRNGGGFNFTDANGKAISALTYAQQTKSDFGKLLSYLGSKGDTYAAQYAKNPGAAGSALTWR